MQLVLSLFPGIDLLGRAFRASGFCVVLGPDTLWDDRIEAWSGTPGKFDGVIGGPPCQQYSDANRRRDTAEGDRLVLEFLRVIDETRPTWWLMENVRRVPDVRLPGYSVQRLDVRALEFGGRQRRLRHIQFGHLDGWIIRPLRTKAERSVTPIPAVLTTPSGPGDRHVRRCAKQDLPHLALSSFTKTARRRVIGNGVPLSIGRALAAAVLAAGGVTEADCICGCGRCVVPPARHATAACRKRMQRKREGPRRVLHWPPIAESLGGPDTDRQLAHAAAASLAEDLSRAPGRVTLSQANHAGY
jgi:DNA (cytosine-5)-methyltransferase 1